jgi:hypothetical protein
LTSDNRAAKDWAAKFVETPKTQKPLRGMESDLKKLVDIGIPIDVLKLAMDRLFSGAPEHEITALLNAAIVKQDEAC